MNLKPYMCAVWASLALAVPQEMKAQAPLPPLPSASQVEWHKMEMYAFIHFGLNTFADKEWGYGDTSLGIFNPTEPDVEQWVRTLKAAGMSGVILTAKHHDGFCLWPTELTDYCIRHTPYKDGKGDLVGELRAACDKYGLKFGLYLSPWDRNHPAYGTKGYVEYYNKQLEELTTRYGNLFEFWLDGANGGDGFYGGARETRNIDRRTYYDFPNLFSHILKNQPDAQIFSDGGPGCRWVGNERGVASATNWAFLRAEEVYPGYPDYPTLQYGHTDGNAWIPAECDVSIRPGWFYHATEDSKVKTPEQLADLYYKSVGHNANLILNFPVDRTGRINKIDSVNAVKFHEIISQELKHDILKGCVAKVSNTRSGKTPAKALTDGNFNTYWSTKDGVTHATIEFSIPKQKVNRLMLQEYIPLGQRVQKFTVEYKQGKEWLPVTLDEETTTIGYKRLLRFPTVETNGLRIRIEEARGSLCLNTISAYYGGPSSEVTFKAQDENFPSVDFKLTTQSDRFILDMGAMRTANVLHYLPAKDEKGVMTRYELLAGETIEGAKVIAHGEFSNIMHNPVLQTLRFAPTPCRYLILKATHMAHPGEAVKAEKLGIELF